jgi:hypothetical protein
VSVNQGWVPHQIPKYVKRCLTVSHFRFLSKNKKTTEEATMASGQTKQRRGLLGKLGMKKKSKKEQPKEEPMPNPVRVEKKPEEMPVVEEQPQEENEATEEEPQAEAEPLEPPMEDAEGEKAEEEDAPEERGEPKEVEEPTEAEAQSTLVSDDAEARELPEEAPSTPTNAQSMGFLCGCI